MALLDLQGMELPWHGGGNGPSSLSVLLCGNSSLSLTTCN
jgi:Lanthionine-containing peptide SapB precursor RamS